MGSQPGWWKSDASERFWLESTDRPDLGTDLHAPLLNEQGKDFWSYSLLKEMQPGDIVFHYYKPEQAIVARSVVSSSQPRSISTRWSARGTSARKNGTQPYDRDGLAVDIKDFRRLEHPVPVTVLAARIEEVREIVAALTAKHGSLYFPFELGNKRAPRALQGYAFKLPKAFVEMFSELAEAAESTSMRPPPVASDIGEPPAAPGRRPVDAYRIIRDTELAGRIKGWHGFRCQLCETVLELAGGNRYAEAHHIQPLGGEHRGHDVAENIICVCPNHHALLDYFAIPLTRADIRELASHRIGDKYLAYHNARHGERIASRSR